MQEATNAYPARYEIWIAACKNHSVIQGCRPVIVIGTDEDLITVVPLSSQLTYPKKHSHALISGQGLDVTSRTLCEHISTLPRRVLLRRIGYLYEPYDRFALRRALAVHLGLLREENYDAANQ